MSFGEELKRERELREITLREVSESTKISLRYLEALESNAFENLPGGVFNRGFVRAYSQFIGVDPDSMVDAYIQQENSQLGEPGKDGRRPRRPALVRTKNARRLLWVWWVVGAIAIAAAAYWGWTWWHAHPSPGNPEVSSEEST